MTTPRTHSPGSTAALGLALLLAGGPALAQAPAGPPPPPAPQRAAARAPDTMPRSAPPPRPVARVPGAAQPAAAAARPAPPPRAGLPPDSVLRTAARPAPETAPAGAVARCRDGTFIVAPSDPSACAAHRGVGVVFPRRPAPPAASARPMPTARVAAPSATPPAGATMRCKDGTWLTGAPSEGRCAANGGTAVILPAARATPPAPRPRRP